MLPTYKKRLPFGQEQNLLQRGQEECSYCGVVRGHPHHPGCTGEECPRCAKMIIGCCCDALSPHDAALIVQALAGQITSLENALSIMAADDCGEGRGPSYLQHAVMQYLFQNLPDSVRSELVEAFHLRFPGLVPTLQDEEGRGYYTAEQLAEALGMPLAEVEERIDAMVSAGQGIRLADGRLLRKVH